MADNNTIEIKFSATGDDKVIKAINDLDKSTKELIKTQANLRGEGQKQKKNTEALRENNRKLYSELKKNGIKSFKGLSLETGVLTRALQGNKVAIRKVRTEMQRLSKTQKNVKKGLLDTEHGTRILGGSFAVLRSKMLLASFGAGLFGASVGRLTKMYGEQEKAEKKLETALGKRSNTLLAFASAQQKVTTFGDEETLVAMSLVGAYTDNEKAIARVTQASMDLATAKGMDLNSAVDMVSKSIFSSTNAMSRYGIQVEGAEGSVTRLESATKNISALYGGQAQASAETFLGSMTQMSNSVGDLGEKFGSLLAPAVMLGAKGIKAFADSIDTEEIKAYGAVLIGVSTAYVAVTRSTLIASKAMLAFNKVSKKNIAVLAGMLVVGAVIDRLNVFADSTGDVADEIERLAGEIDNLNNKSATSLTLTHALQQAEESHANTLSQLHPIEAERNMNALEHSQMLEKHGVTQANFSRMLEENIPFAIEYNKNAEKIALTEQKLDTIKTQSVTNSLKGFVALAQAQTKNAEKLRILALAQAMIDTYSAGNVALKSAPPPFNYIAMAGVIAQGLANVHQIQAQKFEQGGMVGGRRHSQGGTMIEAERGEFVMSRSAVESIGTETLNQMNQGGGAGISLNISAPLVDETILDTIIPAIQKAQRMNLA
jgi:hypothetical protein